MAKGCSSPFCSGRRGARRGGGRGKRPTVMALTPLMAGRLVEGLRGEIKRGIKTWSENLAWHPEVGGPAVQGGRRRREEAAMVGRRGEGDEADRRAPHGGDVREREDVSVGVRNVEENTPFRKYANTAWAEWGAGDVQGVAGQRGVWLG
jgi:hypothetical protein